MSTTSTKTLLLATVFAAMFSLPAFATDAPSSGVGAATPSSIVPSAPSSMVTTGAAPHGTTVPADDLSNPAFQDGSKLPDAAPVAPADTLGDTATPEPTPLDPSAAPATVSAEPTLAPADSMAAPTAAPATPAAEQQPAAVATPDTSAAPGTEPAPVVTSETAPAPQPEKKKVSPPAKLSALAKKYKLMSLDSDGNKSLSKAEFTADGFASAKVFTRFDADGNGKLTNSEINAYAAQIDANSNR